MKTSKIKEVKGINEFQNEYGTTYYHDLEMENGDKINIGKKSECQVGWELDYMIIGDEGQQEYVKAKSVQKENTSTNTTSDNTGYKKPDQNGVQDDILYSVVIKGVMDHFTKHFDKDYKDHENLFSSDNINKLTLEIAKGAKLGINALKQS